MHDTATGAHAMILLFDCQTDFFCQHAESPGNVGPKEIIGYNCCDFKALTKTVKSLLSCSISGGVWITHMGLF